jgi:hypothetical protein
MDEASTTPIAEVGASGKMKERAHSDLSTRQPLHFDGT